MPSFDITSELNQHEVLNAIDQSNREINTRFDFKGSDAEIVLTSQKPPLTLTLTAQTEFQLQQMLDILRTKLTKRQIDLKHLEMNEPTLALKKAQQVIKLNEGINTEMAKEIVKLIKAEKFKVQTAIQGDMVRVTGKKRDDLQEVIAFMRKKELKLPLQFGNFRD